MGLQKVRSLSAVFFLTMITMAAIGGYEATSPETRGGPGGGGPVTIVVNASGGGDHTTIQAGIDAANEGDTVYVDPGIYYENVIVDKPLDLVGSGVNSTTVNGGGNGDVIKMIADRVTVEHLTVTNDGESDDDEYFSGISMENSNDSNIRNIFSTGNYFGIIVNSTDRINVENNILDSNEGTGIDVRSSEGSVIENNIVTNNARGIAVSFFNNGRITNNKCKGNKAEKGSTDIRDSVALYMEFSDENTIADNHVSFSNDGVLLMEADNNDLENNYFIRNSFNGAVVFGQDNTFKNNVLKHNQMTGIEFAIGNNNILTNNTIEQNGDNGVYIDSSSDETIVKNNVIGTNTENGILIESDDNIITKNMIDGENGNGIRLKDQKSNLITFNTICHSTGYGILGSSEMGTIRSNVISNNTLFSNDDHGVFMDTNSEDNSIYHNNLLLNKHNSTQAFDRGSKNLWTNGNEGNFWSDLTSPDTNEDGIVDLPYNLSGRGSMDHYPLTEPTVEPLIFPDAGASGTIYNSTPIHLNGTGSFGYPEITNYTWTFTYNGTPVSLYGPIVEFTFHTAGTYNVTLTIRNKEGNEDTDGTAVYVLEKRAENGSAVITVPGDSPTIQNAVNIARPGDTVFVGIGTYSEDVMINKSITLKGEDKGSTVIAGGTRPGVSSVLEIYNTSDVDITELTFSSSGSDKRGIRVENSENIRIYKCDIRSNGDIGLDLKYTNHSYIHNTTIEENGGQGIYTWASNNNTIENCNITENFWSGIILTWESNDNKLSDLRLVNNGDEEAIYIGSSTDNRISNSSIRHSHAGLRLSRSYNNFITHSDIAGDEWESVGLYSSDGNTLSHLRIEEGREGILLRESDENTIHNSSVGLGAGTGIEIEKGSDANVLFHNAFINQENPALDRGNNIWDNDYPSGGNYWLGHDADDIFSGPDQNDRGDDGILDHPYNIPGGDNRDRYPLEEPILDPDLIPDTPDAPRPLRAEEGDSFIELTWNVTYGGEKTPLIEYRVYRGNESGDLRYHTSVSSQITTYKDTSVKEGAVYYYYVTATNIMGESGPSNLVNASPLSGGDENGKSHNDSADSDSDGYNDTYEMESGSDPHDPRSTPHDRDGDGVMNEEDAYPDDPGRWKKEMGREKKLNYRVVLIILGVVLILLVAGIAYSRIRAGDILENETRRQIYERVNEYPGEHINKIGKELGVSSNTVRYHVRRLKNKGKIRTDRDGKYKYVYPPDTDHKRSMTPAQKGVVKYLAENPGSGIREIAAALGKERQTIHYHLKNLKHKGILRSENGGEKKCWFVVEDMLNGLNNNNGKPPI